jgi:hypothetical protein
MHRSAHWLAVPVCAIIAGCSDRIPTQPSLPDDTVLGEASVQARRRVPPPATPPTKPVVAVLEVGPTHATLNWSSTDDGSFIWYTIFIDGKSVLTVNSKSATFVCSAVLVPTGCTPLDQETRYTFTVQARDVDGNLSPFSDPVLVTTDPAPNDHNPPTQPMNVRAQADGGHIIVSWDPSTDDVAPQRFIRYDVYVNGELRAVVVGEAIAQVEADYGVSNISVIAIDTADNESIPGTTTLSR